MKLYRWMKMDQDGKPRTGSRFGLLGVRPKGGPGKSDVDARDPGDTVSASLPKGMSVSSDPNMPKSPGDDFHLWAIDTDVLGPSLAPVQNATTNNAGHYLIKPAKDMTLQDYQDTLAETREDWELSPPEDGS